MPSRALARTHCPSTGTQRLAGLLLNQSFSFGCGPFPGLSTWPEFSSQHLRHYRGGAK